MDNQKTQKLLENDVPSDHAFDDDTQSSFGSDSANDGVSTDDSESINQAPQKFKITDMPKPTFFIIAMELCERFAFYGLRSILTTYMVHKLHYGEDTAKAIYSYTCSIAYFMPLFGGYVADALLGKFWTIFAFSVIYVAGSTTLAVTSIAASRVGAFVGLAGIAIGTGGIKPCVAAFGAEQLRTTNAAALSTYFLFFYFCINAGSVLSTLLMPVIRSEFSFSVAFVIPAVLLFIALVIFTIGRKWYIIHPPQGSVLTKMVKVICAARREKKAVAASGAPVDLTPLINTRRKRRHLEDGVLSAPRPDTEPHWLDFAKRSRPVGDVEDTKKIWSLLPIFAALPIFWTLFDQQGSSWVLQADKLDRNVFGHLVQPEQVQALNACSVLILVPIFDGVIYPFLRNRGFQVSHLGRMLVGMVFAASAYLFAAWNDHAIATQGLHVVPIYHQLPQYLIMTIAEILISVTGLDLAYTQAPASAKATVAAIYNLTTAVGDLLAGVVFSAFTFSAMHFSLLCAGLMGVNICIFALIAVWYNRNVACYEEDEDEPLPGQEHDDTDKLDINSSGAGDVDQLLGAGVATSSD